MKHSVIAQCVQTIIGNCRELGDKAVTQLIWEEDWEELKKDSPEKFAF